jgi:hypothetical protein
MKELKAITYDDVKAVATGIDADRRRTNLTEIAVLNPALATLDAIEDLASGGPPPPGPSEWPIITWRHLHTLV